MIFEKIFANINTRFSAQSNVENLKLEDVRPVEAFRYLAGSEYHSHPSIYGALHDEGHVLVVVGRGYEQAFLLDEIDKAFAAYRQLLDDLKFGQ